MDEKHATLTFEKHLPDVESRNRAREVIRHYHPNDWLKQLNRERIWCGRIHFPEKLEWMRKRTRLRLETARLLHAKSAPTTAMELAGLWWDTHGAKGLYRDRLGDIQRTLTEMHELGLAQLDSEGRAQLSPQGEDVLSLWEAGGEGGAAVGVVRLIESLLDEIGWEPTTAKLVASLSGCTRATVHEARAGQGNPARGYVARRSSAELDADLAVIWHEEQVDGSVTLARMRARTRLSKRSLRASLTRSGLLFTDTTEVAHVG